MLQGRRLCEWCEKELPTETRKGQRYCNQKCRQSAFRVRRRREIFQRNTHPLRMAYADPPYPGFASMYRNEPDYEGEVDHELLIEHMTQCYDGWALSTSGKKVGPFRKVLSYCPPEARIAAWCKPIGVSRNSLGMHNTWEALIVMPGRRIKPGFRDWLLAQPARFGGRLRGRKTIEFCIWMFRCLGLLPGDELEDLYPGTGIVSRAFRHWSNTR